MSVCCDTVQLGTYPHKGTLTLPIVATDSGVHKITFSLGGMRRTIELSISEGERFTLDLSRFPIGRDVKFWIEQPCGEKYFVQTVEVECYTAEEGYNYFEIKTEVTDNKVNDSIDISEAIFEMMVADNMTLGEINFYTLYQKILGCE